MDNLGFASIPAIIIIVYIIAEVVKAVTKQNETVKTNLPVICGVSGLILAMVAYFFIPGILDVANVYDAMAVGVVSGLAATGANQIFSQYSKGK